MGNITVLFSHCVKKKAKCMNEYKQRDQDLVVQ